MSKQLGEFKVSNDILLDDEALQDRIQKDGYLFFKKLQDPDKLRNLRKDMLEVIGNGGWLEPNTDPINGIADISKRCTEGDPEYPAVYHEVYKLESVHRAGHWHSVVDTMEKIVGEPVLPQPQKIVRLWFPQFTDHTTPAHQDFVHFQGDYETYTCWTPVGDCPKELGGLALVPGSHKARTVYDHHFSLGAGALTVDEKRRDATWLTTDYEIGDCLIFHSLTLHKALPNVTPNKLRVSLDNRYQAITSPIAEHMLQPHMALLNPITWDQIYANWKTDDLKYYWEKLVTEIVPRDTTYADRGFAEGLDLAKQGDPKAILQMKRAVIRQPESEAGKAAAKVLQEIESNS